MESISSTGPNHTNMPNNATRSEFTPVPPVVPGALTETVQFAQKGFEIQSSMTDLGGVTNDLSGVVKTPFCALQQTDGITFMCPESCELVNSIVGCIKL